jgi:hypothetical protein
MEGINLTRIQCKQICNGYNETPLYNPFMLIKIGILQSSSNGSLVNHKSTTSLKDNKQKFVQVWFNSCLPSNQLLPPVLWIGHFSMALEEEWIQILILLIVSWKIQPLKKTLIILNLVFFSFSSSCFSFFFICFFFF